jgi:hypothetical protein
MNHAPSDSGTDVLRQLAERLDQSAIKYANDYGYCVASDLKQAADIIRGVAQAPVSVSDKMSERYVDGGSNIPVRSWKPDRSTD